MKVPLYKYVCTFAFMHFTGQVREKYEGKVLVDSVTGLNNYLILSKFLPTHTLLTL